MTRLAVLGVVGVLTACSAAFAETARGWMYEATDSTPYAWTDISATATKVLSNADAWSSHDLSLPFSIPVFGTSLDRVFIGASGVVSASPVGGTRQMHLQDVFGPGPGSVAAICPLWGDFRTTGAQAEGPDSAVYYQLVSDPGQERLIVQWQDVLGTGGRMTFQGTFWHNGLIEYQYKDLGTAGKSLAIAGLVGDADVQGRSFQWTGDNGFNLTAVREEQRLTFRPTEAPGGSGSLLLTPTDCHVRVEVRADAMLFIDGRQPVGNNDSRMVDSSNFAQADAMAMAMDTLPNGEWISADAFASATGQIDYGSGDTAWIRAQSRTVTSSRFQSGDGWSAHGMAEATVHMDFYGRLEISGPPVGSEVLLDHLWYDRRGVEHRGTPLSLTVGTGLDVGFTGEANELYRIASVSYFDPIAILPGLEYGWGTPGMPGYMSMICGGIAEGGQIGVNVLPPSAAGLPEGMPVQLNMWEILPGESFSFGEDGSAVLTFTYDEAFIPTGWSEALVSVFHWNAAEGLWEDVTADRDALANTITTIEMDSFSPYVVAIPEPASMALLGLAAAALLRRSGRQRASS